MCGGEWDDFCGCKLEGGAVQYVSGTLADVKKLGDSAGSWLGVLQRGDIMNQDYMYRKWGVRGG